MIDRILDYPYRRLFGLRGQLVIGSVILLALVTKFFTGIDSVTLDPMSCALSGFDHVYKPFHKDRILANTRVALSKLMVEKQTILRQVNDGRNPFPSVTDGNIVRARKIDKNKFFWRSYIANLKKENLAIVKCLSARPGTL